MEIKNLNFFYTKVKIKYYNSYDLLKYKSKFNTVPQYNEIKVYLPNWFIEKTQPKSSNSGLIDFRYYIHNYPDITSLLREIATRTSLNDKYQYIFNEEDENLLKNIFSQEALDISENQVTSVNTNKKVSLEKIICFIIYVILGLDREKYTVEFIKEFVAGKINNVSEEIEEYKKVIIHLIKWLEMFSSENLKKEINLSVGEKCINFNIKSHFIREYSNYINMELYNLECNANYIFINYKNNFDGKILELDYANKRMASAYKELESRRKANSLLYEKIEFKAYLRKQNDDSEIYGGLIVLKGLFNFNDADIYFLYKMRQSNQTM